MEQKQQKKLFRRMIDKIKKSPRYLKHAMLGAALGLGIGIAAAGCGRSAIYPEIPNCATGQDAGIQQDAQSQNDAVQFDAQPKQDSGSDAQQTDGGVQPPQYSYTINNLIGDFLDRDPLRDRGKGPKNYPFSTPETDPNANPFSDGAGGSIGQDKISLNRVDGTMFPPFATVFITDSSAAKSYKEQQDLWIGGDSHYSDALDNVVGNINFVSNTLKFNGANDDFGIPVCTTPTITDYTTCKSGGMDFDYATETHRMQVNFLGEAWVLSEMSNPTTPLTNESSLVGGGYVRLAQEAVAGILNKDESFTVDNLRFRYDDYDATNPNRLAATISILDANGNILKKDKVEVGTSKEISVNGKIYRFHVYKVAAGGSIGANWIDAAIFSKELQLMHGQKLDPNYDNNKYWKVYLGWKNKGASVTDTVPDHLRTIILYTDDIVHLSSGGRTEMLPGDYIPIVQDPVNLTFSYKGLSATPSTYSTLQFDLEKNISRTISANEGPYDANGQRVSCTINVPYVTVTSGVSGATFTVDGTQGLSPTGTTSASDNVFIIATNGANCGGAVGALMKGSLFMRPSPSSDSQWVYLDYAPYYNTDSVLVKFPLIGDGISDSQVGSISYQYVRDFMPQIGDFEFAIGEETGVGVSKHSSAASQFGLKLVGASATFNYDAPGNGGNDYYYKTDHMTVFPSAGPFTMCDTWPNSCLMGEGYITERGSVFTSITDTTVTFQVAGELVYSQFVLAKK